MRLAPPMRFRFHEEDRERYGDGWTIYDESALLRVPARELVEIERQIGMSLLAMLDRAHANYTDGNLAAMWVARRLAGDVRPFAEFQPLVLLADWEAAGTSVDAWRGEREQLLARLAVLDARIAAAGSDPAPAGDADPPASPSSPSPESAEA